MAVAESERESETDPEMDTAGRVFAGFVVAGRGLLLGKVTIVEGKGATLVTEVGAGAGQFKPKQMGGNTEVTTGS